LTEKIFKKREEATLKAFISWLY